MSDPLASLLDKWTGLGIEKCERIAAGLRREGVTLAPQTEAGSLREVERFVVRLRSETGSWRPETYDALGLVLESLRAALSPDPAARPAYLPEPLDIVEDRTDEQKRADGDLPDPAAPEETTNGHQ